MAPPGGRKRERLKVAGDLEPKCATEHPSPPGLPGLRPRHFPLRLIQKLAPKENADSIMIFEGRLLKNADTTMVFGDHLKENADSNADTTMVFEGPC